MSKPITVVSNDMVYKNEIPLKVYAFLVATRHHGLTEAQGNEVADLGFQMYANISNADAVHLFNWIAYNYDNIESYEQAMGLYAEVRYKNLMKEAVEKPVSHWLTKGMYVFQYGDFSAESKDLRVIDSLVVRWVEDHWQEFSDWVSNEGSTLTKENYDEYFDKFFSEFVKEVV